LNQSVFFILEKFSSYTNTNQPYKTNNELPQDNRQLITLKRRIRTRWQLYRYPSDKTTNILNNKMSRYKSEQYQLYLKYLNSQNGSLWRALKNLTKVREYTPSFCLPNKT